MNIYAKEGAKVKGVFRDGAITGGYESDQKHAMKFITEGQVYTVERTEVSSWSTEVILKEFPGKFFNSVHFIELTESEIKKDLAKKRFFDF
jgi:hypothetical protein